MCQLQHLRDRILCLEKALKSPTISYARLFERFSKGITLQETAKSIYQDLSNPARTNEVISNRRRNSKLQALKSPG